MNDPNIDLVWREPTWFTALDVFVKWFCFEVGFNFSTFILCPCVDWLLG